MIDIVFDGPPGPESGRFVEVENAKGKSVNVGDWIKRDDGYWVLRIKGVCPQTSSDETPSDKAIGIAARIWCDQDMKTVVMDGDAAKKIARIIDAVLVGNVA